MTPLLKKLNFKGQTQLCILHSPPEFAAEMKKMEMFSNVITSAQKCKEIDFALVFVTSKAGIDATLKAIEKKIKGDAILWVAYPKGASKKYKGVEINRDKGWDGLGNGKAKAGR